MTTILLVRHGMTDAVGRQLVGWTPGVGLNEVGRAQVERLGRNLAALPVQAIYSSPLDRARLTAEAIAAPHGLPLTFRDDLGEVKFGDWTGRLLDHIDPDPEWQFWNAHRSIAATPNGESFLTLQGRMVAELRRIADAHPGSLVAAVSHADAIRAALLQFLGMPADFCLRLDIKPASVSILEFGGDGVRVGSVNIPVDGFEGLLGPA